MPRCQEEMGTEGPSSDLQRAQSPAREVSHAPLQREVIFLPGNESLTAARG